MLIESEWLHKERLSVLIGNLKAAHKATVEVGYFKEQGKHPTTRNNLSYAELMAMQELREDGHDRPLLTYGYIENEGNFEENILDNIQDFMYNGAWGKTHSIKKYLDNIGKFQLKSLKALFGDSSFLKPNTTSTSLRKGFQAPLIETGALRDNLSYRESITNKIQRS